LANSRLAWVATVVCLCAGLPARTGTNCKQSTAIVNVLDRHGVPLTGLTLPDFKVTSHGQSIPVLDTTFSTGARRVVILLDTSGSMLGETSRDEWKIARAAALDFVNSVSAGTQLSLVTFASDIQERTKLSGDRRAIMQWLDAGPDDHRSRPKGHTALFEAVLAALKGLDPVQPGDAIFAVTDGEDNASRKVAPEQIQRVSQGVRLYVFVLYDEFFGEEDFSRQKFFEIVKDSGGFATGIGEARTGPFSHFVYDDRAKAMTKAAARTVSAQIGSYYLLSLDLANFTGSPDLKVETIDANGRTRKDVTVTFPRRVSTCTVLSTRP
jgi:hypothetical protein